MSDPRDKYTPKHPTPTGAKTLTPAHGVPQRTSQGEFDGDTPIDAPPSVVLARIGERTRGISVSANDIQSRMLVLERSVADMRVDVVSLGTAYGTLDGKVDTLVEEAKASREERLERERRAEKRAETELAFRRERMIKVVAIVVPTIAAVGALIAGIISAYNSSGG